MALFRNLLTLARKELAGLLRDHFMLFFVLYAFTGMIYLQATGISHELRNASIAIVDEDQSPLSLRFRSAFRGPDFQAPALIGKAAVDQAMADARYTFVLDVPPDFQSDLLAGRGAELQILVDATAMMQAGIGAAQIQSVLSDEVTRFLARDKTSTTPDAVSAQLRFAFNQTLETTRFTGVMAILFNVTMLSVLLTGAAVIREREHGTLEHLLVMPVRPLEIMGAKVLANGLVVLGMTGLSMAVIIRWALGIHLAGSIPLFMAGTAVYLFFSTALGIFLATVARSMPQLGLLFILIVLPLNLLSGGNTPLESMPVVLQRIMQFSPATQFVAFAQAILYRGADITLVWRPFAAVAGMGTLFFCLSLWRFRRHLAAVR
ncbi:ABC transporter permease [Nitrospirillum iridis]|uniref:ABC-2 type transport system permease protein n=1 Tax=Nitrospirillum iridis TaxID=765888 RepID=A0A7X0EDQ5_9PROT|nr:ABC transporter permease [Nitrospirillum iridis]MBB6250634.1 ABC-2 type transport system permease protein [Nitrospirillum iridis]